MRTKQQHTPLSNSLPHGKRGRNNRNSILPAWLLGLFSIFWAALAIHPVERKDWLLENALTIVTAIGLILTRNKLRFSNLAYTCIFIFFCLHTIGAHYTYSLVPYDEAWRALTGHSLNAALAFNRNQYDRAVHFLYGVLIVVPSLELFIAYAPPKTIWRVLMPIFFIMSHSVIYETIEWLAALIVAPDLGQAYLGTQGDEWDAQKDMALATLGATLSILIMRVTPAWKHRFVV